MTLACTSEDIRQHCEEIAEHVREMDYEEFLADRRTYKAVAYSLMVIGEAAKHVPDDLRARYPEVAWHRITALRNVLSHGYFALRDAVLWETVRDGVPELRAQVQRILDDLG